MSKYVYGVDRDSKNDVSPKADQFKSSGVIKIPANLSFNQVFGDPALGQPKTLSLSFSDGVKISVPEVRRFDLQIRVLRPLEIVVARYNETLHWMQDHEIFKEQTYTIYNKGSNSEFCSLPGNYVEQVENLGRNDHTYIYHIVRNYGCLADITVFLPGSLQMPFKIVEGVTLLDRIKTTGKAWMFGTFCDDLAKHFEDFTLDRWKCSEERNKSLNGEEKLTPAESRPFGNWYRKQFGDQKTQHYFYHGTFSVDRATILKRPLSFYQDLLRQLSVSSNPEVGHYMERSWHAMFPDVEKLIVPNGLPFIFPKMMSHRHVTFVSVGPNFLPICEQARKSRLFNHVHGDASLSIPQVLQSVLVDVPDDELICFANASLIMRENAVETFKILSAILSCPQYDCIVSRGILKEIDANDLDTLLKFPSADYQSKQFSTSCFVLKNTDATRKAIEEWTKMPQTFSLFVKLYCQPFVTINGQLFE